MEQNIRLLAADRDIGRCSFGNGIGRSRDVLLFLVLGWILIGASLMLLDSIVSDLFENEVLHIGRIGAYSWSAKIGVRDSQLDRHRQLIFTFRGQDPSDLCLTIGFLTASMDSGP